MYKPASLAEVRGGPTALNSGDQRASGGAMSVTWTGGKALVTKKMGVLVRVALCGISAFSLCCDAGAQTFRDVSAAAGFFGENSSWAAAWADYDRDGDVDVITLGHVQQETGSITQLWRNNGDGTFTDVTLAAGLNQHNGDCHGAVWGDFDNDGNVDLYIAKGSTKTKPVNFNELWKNNGDGTFTNIASLAGVIGLNQRGRGANSVDYDGDGRLDIFVLDFARNANDSGNALYRNDGDMRFTDLAEEAGVARQGAENRAAAWADLNGDGLPDLIMVLPCALFTNDGEGAFREVTAEAGVNASPSCASAAWGDYDDDGDLDLYVTASENVPGTLYRNNRNGTFSDVTEASGILNSNDARGVVWGDYDNDGDLDLYVVNRANAKAPNRLYRNNGGGTFADVTAEAGVEVQVEGGGVDASFADYNNDGFLDLFVTNGAAKKRGPYVLLQNRSKAQGNRNHWQKVRLVGRQSNRDGLMTKVWAATAQGTQFREHTGPGHYMSQDRMPLHFGMGTATVTRLELSWPSGTRQVVENLAVDQAVPVVEGESIAQGRPPTTAPGYNLWQSDTGEWHLRWYGEPGEPRHQFTGHISTDGVFTAVTPQSFEDNDVVTWDAGTITFSALARDTFDEVVFVTTGAEVRLDLQQDGAAHPRSIRIGRHGIRPGSLPLVLPNS
jgi:enediyne biosynthesis protein E4